MIGHFPTPYPDELLYSLCARFSARVQYSNVKSVHEELFGTRNATTTFDLPNNLYHLSAALPDGSSLSPEHLISQHTLLPFFSSFLPRERVTQLKADLKDGRGQASYMRSGVMASRIPNPRYLRFCPICVEEEKCRLKEAYWHRTHQVSGVEVCPIHEVFLEESSVSRHASRHNLQFITADEATRVSPPRLISLSDRDHQVLLQIARDVTWLLEHFIAGTELIELHNRYLRLLMNRQLATYTGSIHVTALLGEFKRHYSSALLRLLRCEFTGSDHLKTNWLLRLVRPPKHAQHPLYHLLLMQFLGCTPVEFFRLPCRASFFGDGPWPCLNPAAGHYRELVIHECILSPRLRDNRPVGTFSCECGFSYARSGPDSLPEDRFRVGRMLSFGQMWEAKLMELWRDSSLSISEIGRQLGVDPLTIRRHASRLKLPFSRSGRKTKTLKRAAQLKGSTTSAVWERKHRTYRSKWLSLMRRNPQITLKALRQKLPREYVWLLRNDSNWLDQHTSRHQRSNLSTTSVDWKKRDAAYAVAVKTAALSIKDIPSRPVQVSKTAIGRAIGAITLLQQKLGKMPLTAEILDFVIETQEEYAIRRVRWVAERYIEEGIAPKQWQLILRANVNRYKGAPRVKNAIESVIKAIDLSLLTLQNIDNPS